MASIRSFNDSDWALYAGAQPIGTRAPLICDDLEIDTWRVRGATFDHVVAVVDARGAELIFTNGTSGETLVARCPWALSTVGDARALMDEVVADLGAGSWPSGCTVAR